MPVALDRRLERGEAGIAAVDARDAGRTNFARSHEHDEAHGRDRCRSTQASPRDGPTAPRQDATPVEPAAANGPEPRSSWRKTSQRAMALPRGRLRLPPTSAAYPGDREGSSRGWPLPTHRPGAVAPLLQ